MRLEFDKEDLHREIEFYKSKVFPQSLPTSAEFRPVFSRTSIGRARIAAESKANKDKK